MEIPSHAFWLSVCAFVFIVRISIGKVFFYRFDFWGRYGSYFGIAELRHRRDMTNKWSGRNYFSTIIQSHLANDHVFPYLFEHFPTE